MSTSLPTTRRRALELLAGVPLLPLSTSLAAAEPGDNAAAAQQGSAGDATASAARVVRASFLPMAAPHDAAAMATTTVRSALELHLADGSTRRHALDYRCLFMTGDALPDGRGGTIIAGGCFDIHQRPLIDRSVPGRERQFFSNAPDGSSLLALPHAQVPGIKGKAVFAVVQFEYTSRTLAGGNTFGRLPSPVAVLTLDQDPATGHLTLVKYHNVDTAPAHGLWITCGASLSPWNTHLGSEEYEPDAFHPDGYQKAFRAFSQHLFGSQTTARPYHYGHVPEVTVHPDGTGTVKKHYCLGRISHELVQVMPDRRTVLMGDDCTNGGLFVFVADRAGDLSAGTLYVARIGPGFSLRPAAAGGAPLAWIRLGHATSAAIERLADTLEPQDIMAVHRHDPHDASFTPIFFNGRREWVRVQPGMRQAAAFLETHRYAALVGASMVFTKLEGTTLNARDKIAYSALQNVEDSMVAGGKGWSAEGGIALHEPLKAGAVLAHDLAGGLEDTDGTAIASDWMPLRTRTLLTGRDLRRPDALGNTADPGRVANPDNLKFSETLRTLFIGEDSDQHVTSFLWAYDVDTARLSRLLSVPAGAESTGLHAVDELHGWAYVMTNFQHAGDWSQVHSRVRATLDPLVRAGTKDRYGAAVGYLTCGPASKSKSKQSA